MKQLVRKTVLSAALVVALAVPALAGAVDKLTTEKEKASYMVGLDVANSLKPIKDEVDIAIVVQAFRTALEGGTPLLSAEESQAVRQQFMTHLQNKQAETQRVAAEKNKADGEKFLAANKSKPGIKTTASGLQYQVIKEGTGPKPGPNSQVKVHYLGTLIDGTKFDSSYDRDKPAEFALNGVIPGWTEALQLMPAGSKYKLFIPSNLAYGDRGTPGPIGPNATLVFEVELLEILN